MTKYNGKEIILATQLKNAIQNLEEGMEFYLKNININGSKRGCSGFVKNPKNEKVVYITTERIGFQPVADKAMFRYAKSTNDYSSINLGAVGRNQWCDYDKNTLAYNIIELLRAE